MLFIHCGNILLTAPRFYTIERSYRSTQAWRVLPAAVILGLLLAGMASGKDFERLGFAPHAPLTWRKVLFLLPMLVVATENLWHGVVLRYVPSDTLWYIIAMLCIGFVEEILFRGYLLPCCLFHGVFNALAAFSKEVGQTVGYQIAVCAVISLLSVGYAAYLWKQDVPLTAAEANLDERS